MIFDMLKLSNPNDIPRQIGMRFRKARLMQNIALHDLEGISGVTQPTIQRFETTGRTTLTTLVKLADALGLVEALEPLVTHHEPPDIENIIKVQKPRQRAHRGAIGKTSKRALE
jgi:transcriptional regulator with XRE-family HTH domain